MIGGEISVKILVFILDYFQEKLVTIFFQNFQKKIEGCFGLFLAQVWQKWIFQEVRVLSVYNYLLSC